MSVHYKFKSALDFDTITFDGLHISVADLKKAIIHQKRLGKTMDFDLQITNAQTKEEYGDDSVLIPKNTSLTIARVPLKNAPKKNWEPKSSDNSHQGGGPQGGRKGQDGAGAGAAGMQANVDLSTMNGTEEDKIREMMFQSTAEYDPTNYQRIRGQSQIGEVPINYKCYRCQKPGHWIKNCPLGPLPKEAMEVVKRTSGIPRSFIERDKDPENNPIIQLPQAPPEEKQVIPEDLICAICKDLFTDAVMIPCCGSSFCDECVRTALLESEDNECPDCKEKGSSPGSLIPNRFLRNSVNAFRNETGYTKAPPKASNKQTKPVEEPANVSPELTAVSSSTNVGSTAEASHGEHDAEEKHLKEHTDEGQQESTDHCDLHESYEEVSQHGDIGSPNGDDKVFDNDSDYEDGITVTVPPAHVQSRGASRLHYNGRSSHYPRHETPPTGGYEYPREPYNSGTSSSGGSRGERPEVSHEEGAAEARSSKQEDKEASYNAAPSAAPKHEYGSRSPDYHQPSRGLMPHPTRGHPPQHPPMAALPPHSGYMGAPHQGPAGPGYPGAPHAAPHPYPGAYGMQPGYPPQRPYEHPGGMYHGERPPRMMYPPRGGYAPHPPHMRPRHMAPMGPGGYPGVPHVGTGVIDDPLEAFNRIMREKERRKEQEAKQASRHRSSPHADRSRRSRSFENAGGNRGRRSAERDRRRSPRARSPERRRSPEEKHGGERERERGGGGRRRNRSSSYSSGSRSYSRSPAKRGKSPKRRSSRSPQYRERRSRSRSKSFEERRHSKHGKERSRDERRDDHRGEYRDNRERSPGYGSHYSGYRGRGGYRGGMRGRGGSRGDSGYFPRSGYGERGHMPQQGPPVGGPGGPPLDQYGHPMGPVDYHHHDPAVAIGQHHHGVVPIAAHGVPPGGHYAPPQQQPMPTSGAVPSRYPPRDAGRGPYMGHPVKPDPMAYYEGQPQPVPVQQQQPAPVSVEPPPPGFEEQDNWSGKQETEYRPPATVTAIKTTEEASYEYHNTPKSRDHERAHTPVIRDDRHDQMEKDAVGSSSKKKSRDDGETEHHRSREERRARSKTPDRHDKDKSSSKRGEHDRDKDKKRGDVSKEKRVAEKERHRESEKDREKEPKRKQRDSSEEEKKDKKKEKEKKKRKKEKEAEKKKHKKERKEKDKRSKEAKKERKTVEKEEADSSLQPATPKHAPRREEVPHEKEQPQVDTTQEYISHELDDTLVIPERCHDLSKTASENEDNSYREEPSSSHDQQEPQQQEQIDMSHDHSDLYSDIPDKYEEDQLEKSVLEGHIGDEDTDLVNSSGVAAEDPLQEEIKRSDSILDLHANLDFEGDLEEGEHQSPPKFIGIPELSKWELDEDTPLISSTERKITLDDHIGGSGAAKHEDSSNKVTNEVLKRAENAIFTRAINAIRPIEIKKISVDRQKLYANEALLEHDADVVEIKNDKQQDELKRFQVTVPTNDDHAERSVEIKLDVGKLESRVSPVRGSIKERLGSKITDIRGSSSSTFSRSRTPPPALRKVKSSTATSLATSSSKLVDSSTSSTSRKRSRSKSTTDRDSSRSRQRGGADDRSSRREEIKISSSSGGRRLDIGRRIVVSVREVTPEKRREVERKDRRDGRSSRERVTKEVSSGDRNRDRVVRRSRERSREKRQEREREREKERKRADGKESDLRKGDTRSRKSPERSSGASHGHKDDKKLQERKRNEADSDRRRRDRDPSPAVRRNKEEDQGKRFVEALGRVVQEEVIPAKKSKPEKSVKPVKPVAGSSSDSSSSDSESSSSDSSSDSDDEAARKRKKRKHKKDRKRAKRSASTDSDDSGSKKKKKSKKSKSGKKKKKEKKHRKGE